VLFDGDGLPAFTLHESGGEGHPVVSSGGLVDGDALPVAVVQVQFEALVTQRQFLGGAVAEGDCGGGCHGQYKSSEYSVPEVLDT
jgi:hypothetical protein